MFSSAFCNFFRDLLQIFRLIIFVNNSELKLKMKKIKRILLPEGDTPSKPQRKKVAASPKSTCKRSLLYNQSKKSSPVGYKVSNM